MQVGAISNGVADVDPDTKAYGTIWRLISIKGWNLLLHLNGTSHRSVDAVEYDEQGIAASLNDPAAVLLDGGVDQSSAEGTQSFERSNIVQADQTAVADHVRVHYGDQLPPIWRLTDEV